MNHAAPPPSCPRAPPRRVIGVVALTLALCAARTAHAGGFELPDNGTEGLGRGAAFTAKADDGTALWYNVAGFAGQRGTRLLFNGNLTLSSYQFQRSGKYADDPNDPRTPWGGQPYPLVKDEGTPFFAPFLAASTDFGSDRFTLAAGVFGPSGVANRLFPLGVERKPAPGRYDVVQAKPRIIYPTIAAAYRVLPWLDVGVGVSLVLGTFDLTSVSLTYVSKDACPNLEYQPCDAQTHIETAGNTWTPTVGVMLRPASSVEIGAQFRAGYTIASEGTATATPPAVAPIKIDPAPATFTTSIPWVLRYGVRYVARDSGRERWDAEIDGTYEAWGGAQGVGPTLQIPKLGIYDDIHPTVVHNYKDTFSVRLGGQYNVDVGENVLSLRAGAFYDASATRPGDTRLDFDTLEKYGLTVGAGFRWSGVAINVAYAAILEPTREITDGAFRSLNGANHGLPSTTADQGGQPFPVVNSGTYSGHDHIVSFGVQVFVDEIFGFGRGAARPSDAVKPAENEAKPADGAPKAEDEHTPAVQTPRAAPPPPLEEAAPEAPAAAPAPSPDPPQPPARKPKPKKPKPRKPKPKNGN